MANFDNCSQIAISGGTFTRANHVSNVRIVHKNIVNVAQREEERTRWDDYNRVRIGDICIESSVTTSSVRRDYDDEEARKRYYRRIGLDVLDARRKFGIARLRGEDREDKFLCVTYEGSEAFKAFKQDFDEFSRFKHKNVAQIFGFNDNERGIPALLFYDALIPLERIIVNDDDGQVLLLQRSYFEYQFSRMRMEISEFQKGLVYIAELWVDPRTGALQKGPRTEQSLRWPPLRNGIVEGAMPNIDSNYLPISALRDNDTVLAYLARTFPAQTVFQAILWRSTPFMEHLANEHVTPVLSSLPGTIFNTHSRRIIARWRGARERLQYMFKLSYTIPHSDAMQKSQVVMDNGLVRFTATKVNELEEIYLEHGLPELDKSWLAQAHHVFGQLQIHPDEWKDYAMFAGFGIPLRRSSPPEELNVPPEVYLFILPIPQPSDDEGIWRSWAEGEKYFWSFDPFGQERLSDFELPTSGIPSFTSTIISKSVVWNPSDHDIMYKLQVAKGFDPTTTDFAVATGCPILEVIGDDDRFEDFEESSSDILPPRTRRRGTFKRPSRASTFWLDRKSRTKNVGAADAKIMKSSRRVRTSSKQRVGSQTTGSWSRAERLRKHRRSIKDFKDRGQRM